MTRHAFVDESFQRNYTMAAAVLPAGEVNAARSTIRQLLRPGQKRIHFKQESDARRSQVLDTLETLDLRARLYVAVTPTRHARDVCLELMIPDLAAERVRRVLLERDDSLVQADRKLLYHLTRKHAPDMEYDHMRAHEDLLLCGAAAIAWCWTRGGCWRARVAKYCTEIRV